MTLFLFSLSAADFTFNSDNCHIKKFSHHFAVVGHVTGGGDREYRELKQDFVAWCQLNHLQINAGGGCLQEQILSSSTGEHPGYGSDTVASYKYLGVHLNNKLDWTDNTTAVYKKVRANCIC